MMLPHQPKCGARCSRMVPKTVGVTWRPLARPQLTTTFAGVTRRNRRPPVAIRALTGRARVLMAQGEPKQAESDAHDALTRAAEIEAHIGVPDILEVLADLAEKSGSHLQRRGSSARHRPSGNASAWSASRSMTPATKLR
jgi:hypothetical protein